MLIDPRILRLAMAIHSHLSLNPPTPLPGVMVDPRLRPPPVGGPMPPSSFPGPGVRPLPVGPAQPPVQVGPTPRPLPIGPAQPPSQINPQARPSPVGGPLPAQAYDPTPLSQFRGPLPAARV